MAGVAIGAVLRQIGRLYSGGAIAGQDDAALVRRFAAARDSDAFAGLVARHGPMVLAVCRGVLRDPADAEDAFQATFLVLARRAGSLQVHESLGGWLYRVAQRVARRANADARKLAARERQGVEMDAFTGPDERAREQPVAVLHAELARLPEAMRRVVVLCELEGMTQVDAARVLRCGEATVRRRLAAARERLRERLASRGVAPASIASLLKPADLPSGWAEAAVRGALATGRTATAAARLAASVAASMVLARRLRLAAFVVVGVASTWGIVAAQQSKPEAPKPAQVPPAKAEAPAPPTWAHLTSDAGLESWVRLDDGLNLWKYEQYAGVTDPASGTQLHYMGNGPIERRPDIVGVNDDGSRDVGFALDRAGVRPLEPDELRRRMTEEGRRTEGGNFRSEAQVVELDGRRCLRIDMSRPDALGQLRLSEQTWYDVETRRPIQRRTLLQQAAQTRYEREFGTTTIRYGDRGPADIYALGVPAGTPIVDEGSRNKVDVPAALQRAFVGAATAIERLPRSLRIVEERDNGLQLTYWSAPNGYLEAKAADVRRDHGDGVIHGSGTPQSFSADHQGPYELDFPPAQHADDDDAFPADALAAWLPVDKSVNVHLNDGTTRYDLTRFFVAADKPRRVEVHVLPGDQFNELPNPIHETWGFAFDNRRNLELVPAEPGTPEGWLAIKVEYPQIRELYYVDPAHGYAVARKVEWSDLNGGRMKFRTDSKALDWAQLPGGVWYVTTWERRHHLDKLDAQGKPEAEQQPDTTSVHAVVITPMEPKAFPPGIFDGKKFLDAARREGAKIGVD